MTNKVWYVNVCFIFKLLVRQGQKTPTAERNTEKFLIKSKVATIKLGSNGFLMSIHTPEPWQPRQVSIVVGMVRPGTVEVLLETVAKAAATRWPQSSVALFKT